MSIRIDRVMTRLEGENLALRGSLVIAGKWLDQLQKKRDELKNKLAEYEQTCGVYCSKCGWRMIIPSEGCRCDLEKEVERLKANAETDREMIELALKSAEDLKRSLNATLRREAAIVDAICESRIIRAYGRVFMLVMHPMHKMILSKLGWHHVNGKLRRKL